MSQKVVDFICCLAVLVALGFGVFVMSLHIAKETGALGVPTPAANSQSFHSPTVARCPFCRRYFGIHVNSPLAPIGEVKK